MDKPARVVIRSDAKTRSNKTPPTVAIVDKGEIVRAGLTRLLEVGGFRVVGGGSRFEDIPERLFRRETNQLVLVTLDHDAAALLTQIRSLKQRHDSVRIVVLSESLHAHELLSVLGAGVNCIWLSSEVHAETLVKSLELVLLGSVIFPSSLLNSLKGLQLSEISLALKPVPDIVPVHQVRDYCSRAHAMQNDANIHLSAREQAILRYLMRGASNKVIARELDVAEATIKVHVRGVLRKIRASNRTQAAMWANKFLEPVAGTDTLDPGTGAANGTLQ